jgi:hypothetical protein
MPILWQLSNGAQRVGTAIWATPAGQQALTNAEKDVYWLAAGWAAVAGGMAWMLDSDPVKPHPDVDLPASGAWRDLDPILCTAHPFWDCYAANGPEGCLGRAT